MRDHATQVLAEGFAFPEGPRWHDGLLWFSDMHAGEVRTVDASGESRVRFEVDAGPSGLGWMPDGTLLVVSQEDHRVLRWDGRALTGHADLEGVAAGPCNDMVVDARGNAYVGNFGFDLYAGETPVPTCLALVTPKGDVSVAAADLLFPNGAVVTPDGTTLVVGETFAAQLTAFDIGPDGSLGNRRIWARLAPGDVPDGCCLDAAGAIWVASPTTGHVVRVEEGGHVTDRVTVSEERSAYACMLGGADGRTLFCCTSSEMLPSLTCEARSGAIETVAVDIPHAGLP
ncbi:MAG: SMP-30/gluconolactonase/LRE family protein [Acidimicrobiia bacterium]|nr:SMP-30/gluconolactonase/LRE family protein [Acidimicrobiia bacterium]